MSIGQNNGSWFFPKAYDLPRHGFLDRFTVSEMSLLLYNDPQIFLIGYPITFTSLLYPWAYLDPLNVTVACRVLLVAGLHCSSPFPPSSLHSILQHCESQSAGSFHLSFSLSSLSPVNKIRAVSSNRLLPSSSRQHPPAMAVVYIVLEIYGMPPTNNLIRGISHQVVGLFGNL